MVDMYERDLISLLEQDARKTSEEIAKQLSASPSTVRRRMSQLLKQGIIRIVAIPDSKKIGLSLTAVVAFQLVHEKLNEFTQTMKGKENVKCLFITSGRYDALALMWFSSTEELYQFMEKEVGNIEGIKATETSICLHTEKGF